jgi:hypothetical protein
MTAEKLDNRLQTVTWGIIIILFGGLSLIPGDQANIFVLGIGIVLLGLNLLRFIKRIPVNTFSIVLGMVALSLGGIASLRSILGWKFQVDLPLFPLLLIAFGLYLLLPSSKEKEDG